MFFHSSSWFRRFVARIFLCSALLGWLLAQGVGSRTAQADAPPAGFYEGTIHTYCPSFDYTDKFQLTVRADGTAFAFVPSRQGFNSQGQAATNGAVQGLSLQVQSLSRGQVTIAYAGQIAGDAVTASGRSEDILVDVRATRSLHPGFFSGEVALSNGVYYLGYPNGTFFGYYSYAYFPYLYHFDFGFAYFQDAEDGRGGAYLYDFKSGTWFYTGPNFPFPYLFDFSLNTLIYYFPSQNAPDRYSSNPRYFVNLSTGQFFSK